MLVFIDPGERTVLVFKDPGERTVLAFIDLGERTVLVFIDPGEITVLVFFDLMVQDTPSTHTNSQAVSLSPFKGTVSVYFRPL